MLCAITFESSNTVIMKIQVTETSGATFTSYAPYESTVEEMIGYGHKITDLDIEYLKKGHSVSIISYNRVGTRTKRILKAI
jgi:hypothetical protein